MSCVRSSVLTSKLRPCYQEGGKKASGLSNRLLKNSRKSTIATTFRSWTVETQEDPGFSPHYCTVFGVETLYGFSDHSNPRAEARGYIFFNSLLKEKTPEILGAFAVCNRFFRGEQITSSFSPYSNSHRSSRLRFLLSLHCGPCARPLYNRPRIFRWLLLESSRISPCSQLWQRL